MPQDADKKVFDAIVIGTGFGGAVTARRLAEAKLNICVLERGRRYEAQDFLRFPSEAIQATLAAGQGGEAFAPPPDLSRWSWDLDLGLWDVRDLGDGVAVQAAGYGGGSLVYANVHLRPPRHVFDDWPDDFKRIALDGYFNLAAHMLDVAPLPGKYQNELWKTRQLEHFAATNKRCDDFFHPPLAVSFRARTNVAGMQQEPCDLRGECMLGCAQQAKNTLDLNYLALAEQESDTEGKKTEGKKFADIRTMAEALYVERLGTLPVDGPNYKVAYHDHLDNDEKDIFARYVFLCAGAVGTTELLWRSQQAGKLGTVPFAKMGERYHPNADSIGLVFGSRNPQEAGRGPTITASLVYDAASPNPGASAQRTDEDTAATEGEDGAAAPAPAGSTWFLVQDGGLPAQLGPLMGLFRSPLWLRRNRYKEAPANAEPEPERAYAASALDINRFRDAMLSLPENSLRRRGRHAERRDTLLELALGMGSRSFQVEGARMALASGDDSLRTQGAANLPPFPPDDIDDPWRCIPDQLRDALREDVLELTALLTRSLEPWIERFMARVAEDIATRLGFGEDAAFNRRSVSWLLRYASQLLWGSQAGLAQAQALLIKDELAIESPGDLVPKLVPLMLWLLDYRVDDGHTGMLLTMGLNRTPGRFRIAWPTKHGSSPRVETLDDCARWCLEVDLPQRRVETPERIAQENLMRDIASVWGGELRTNPLWTFMRKRVSVHNQGGCPMADSPADGITSVDGEVFGCEGLFVMDAAAFPGPVGANPSATVAAVAEYKVAQFLRRHVECTWETQDWKEAQDWAAKLTWTLDPLNKRRASAAPSPEPVGLEFREWMSGSMSHSNTPPIDETPEERVSRCRDAARRGARAGADHTIRVEVQAQTPDLRDFLDGNLHEFQLAGTIESPIFAQLAVGAGRQVSTKGTLRLFTGKPDATIRRMDYELEFTAGGRDFVLNGCKFLTGRDRFRLWYDTTTTYFDIVEKSPASVTQYQYRWSGVLRVSAYNFFNRQLSSHKALNTTDPARQSWAIGAFAQFFFGHLTDVYIPEMGTFKDLLAELLRRTHA